MTLRTQRPAGEVLAEVNALLDEVDPDRARATAGERLAWVRLARTIRSRVDALATVLTAEADRAHAAEDTAGTALASWLGTGETLSRREALGAVRGARREGNHAGVSEAAVAGRIATGQARAISAVLDGLAAELDVTQQTAAEDLLLQLAGHLDADQLARSAGRVLREIVPERAEESLETRLQREAEAAHRQRSLRFFYEGASVRFDGSLPRADAEVWIAQLDAHAEQTRRTRLERRDPLAVAITPEQRRADALVALNRARTTTSPDDSAPSPARVLVLLDHAQLAAGAAGAGMLPDGTPLSSGDLRRLCCDAELIPVVLGAPSAVLDVGRAERLVTPELRAALIARDRGCSFPGCDAPPARCEAHHVLPWWAGGPTALHNLVLLCHTHHPTVEPARFALRDQWQVRIAPDGLPEFLPPVRLDPARAPVRHARHRELRDTGPPPAA